jgi:hypothetical protein
MSSRKGGEVPRTLFAVKVQKFETLSRKKSVRKISTSSALAHGK